jgi:PAS domain S-box-containing protein
VLEALEGGIIVLDGRRRVMSWNRWIARASGIAATEALGRDIAGLFPGLEASGLWTAIGDSLETGMSRLLTYSLNPTMLPLHYRDGRALLHSVAVRSLPDEASGDMLCLVQISDVTAVVERERLLRDRRDARHRAVVDTAAEAIVTTDADGTIRWINPAGERQFGYGSEELIGQSIGRLLGTDATTWVSLASLVDGGASEIVPVAMTGQHSDGSVADIELSLSRWESGGRSYVTGILRDVTARVRTERRLQHHNERALLLASAATQLLAATDPIAVVHDLFGLVSAHLRLDAFFHYVATADGSALELAASGGIAAQDARAAARLELGEAVCGQVALRREPSHVTGIQSSDDPALAFVRQVGLDTYACTPLVAGGTLLGTLGFGRRAPESAFDEDELRFLRTICHYVAMAQERLRAQAALQASEERLRLAVEGTGMATWDLDLATGRAVWSRHHFTLLGYPPDPAGAATREMFRARLHPEDVPAFEAEWARARREADVFRSSFRIRRADDGAERWMEAYGRFQRDGGGAGRFIGVFFDVTERRAAEERQTLLMREVDHRAKNALAVVRSVLRLTRAEDPRRYAEAVEGRVSALARAHTLLAQDYWRGAGIQAVVEQELAPYRGEARVVIGGPPLRLVADAVQPLSMALHELATNAAKYGALSVPGGRVEVSWVLDPATGRLRLHWAEHGGPPIAAPPERRGFGSTLVAAIVRGQLGGAAELRWDPAGLRCTLEIAPEKLSREGVAAPGALPGATPAVAEMGDPGLFEVSLQGRRVLVAEDEPTLAMELQAALTGLGCEVLGPATTVEEGLSLALREGPRGIDIAVLDVNLHGRTVFPLAEMLQERGVPVLYATGYGELPEGRLRRGSSRLLPKPVDHEDLVAMLRLLLAAGDRAADH